MARPDQVREKDPRAARTGIVIATLSLAGMIAALQQMLVVPVLPEVPAHFGVSQDSGTWMVTASLLAGAVATPIVSRLADMVGKRRMILICLVVMAAGSLLLALFDESFAAAVTGRALQGSAAALIPVGISIMRDELPPNRVSFGVALMSATLGIGTALGLPLSGLLYQHWGWSSLFWVSGAGSLLVLVAVALLVNESRVKTPGRFDLPGALLLSVALTAFLLAVSKGGSWGWTSPAVVGLLALTVAVGAFWVPFELRVKDPMVDLRTAARRPVLLTNVASVLIALAMYVNMLITITILELPEALEHGIGMDVSAAGLAMVPSGLVMVVLSPFSGMILNRFGGRLTMAVGAAIMSVAYLARIPFSGSAFEVILGSTLVGLGTALAFAAMPMLIMASVPITETAAANGINSLARAVGGATSTAIFAAITTVMVVRTGGHEFPSLGSFHLMFVLCAAATAAAVGVTWLIPSRAQAREKKIGAPRDADQVETVVRGTILIGGEPPRQTPAIVTVTHLDGSPVDWAWSDQSGGYSVALPGPGTYVVVGNARGWSPRAHIFEYAGGTSQEHVALTDQLMLRGTVTDKGTPVAAAMVALHAGAGEFVQSTVSAADGGYDLPLPSAGPYVVTAASAATGKAHSRKVIVTAASLVVDIELAEAEGVPKMGSF
ncbi:MFS transporter [Nocardioides sp. AE5]|uniref:MFS transporter n=1 Tax=Nocardioides sp. AE5 TaxID=2962573 RepID=UPI002881BF0C|nr:MFS transporter [Nocardioides sp. AE5]MDT0201567.1 MFS transporter [Nocardioides sp. AE5]